LDGGSATILRKDPARECREILSQAAAITLTDAAGNEAKVSVAAPLPETGQPGASQSGLGLAGPGLADLFALPPVPPATSLDVRYASGRWLEFAAPGVSKEFPLAVTGGTYPLTVRIAASDAVTTAAFIVDGKQIQVAEGKEICIATAPHTLSLRIGASQPLPKQFALDQNYPNPFNPATTIRYRLPVASNVRLEIYDILGQLVKSLVSGPAQPGVKEVEWNSANDAGSQVASGIYFYRLEAVPFNSALPVYTSVRKMILLR
jgi:hypothetical protein